MHLNIPIAETLDGTRSILIAGMGGGFDVFCGLPLYFDLRERGHTVHLANYSFSDIENAPLASRFSPTLGAVTAADDGLDQHVYFPEYHLARWFDRHHGQSVPVWCFHKTGVRPLADNYRALTAELGIEVILLIDGGVDSLSRGDESGPGTLLEDAVSLAAVRELDGIDRWVVCCAMGAERQMAYGEILQNMAELVKTGAFLGACALTRRMASVREYEAAVEFVHDQPIQDPSVINASLLSALRGEYGDSHLTEKTRGSILNITPLMSLYWFFDFEAVAANNYLLGQIAHSDSFLDTYRRAIAVMEILPRRAATRPPLG